MKKQKNPSGKGTGMNRREFLQAGALGGVALLLPMSLTSRLAEAAPSSPTLTKFTEPLAIPKVLMYDSAGITVAMRQFKQRIHGALPETTVWGYGNDTVGFSTPGPTILVDNNDDNSNRTTVTWRNELADDANAPHYLPIDPRILADIGGGETAIHGATNNRKAVVHLHGAQGITDFADGRPEYAFLPGTAETYDYGPQPRGATLWYHDHAIGNTRLNVYMGLAGAFVFRDKMERDLVATGQLPDIDHDMPLVLQDRRLKKNGQLAYGPYFDDTFMGDVMLVNGKAWPFLAVEPRKYRFRLLNGSNTRNYALKLGGHDGQPALMFQQIGSDGGFLAAPLQLGEITLTPGERADVVVDFTGMGGMNVDLSNHHMMKGMKDESPIHEIMQFRVNSATVTGDVTLPAVLATIPTLTPTAGIPPRYFKLEDEFDPNVGDAKWHITGPTRSDGPAKLDVPTHMVKNGTVEVWNWVNKSEMVHPMHIHLVQFQVLGRWKAAEDSKGNLIPGKPIGVDANEMGWKDTVRVGPLEFVRVIARFNGDPNGPHTAGAATEMMPFHCHVLEHEDHEMMRMYEFEY